MTNRGETIRGKSISSSNSDISARDALVEIIRIDRPVFDLVKNHTSQRAQSPDIERDDSQAAPSIPQQSTTSNRHLTNDIEVQTGNKGQQHDRPE